MANGKNLTQPGKENDTERNVLVQSAHKEALLQWEHPERSAKPVANRSNRKLQKVTATSSPRKNSEPYPSQSHRQETYEAGADCQFASSPVIELPVLTTTNGAAPKRSTNKPLTSPQPVPSLQPLPLRGTVRNVVMKQHQDWSWSFLTDAPLYETIDYLTFRVECTDQRGNVVNNSHVFMHGKPLIVNLTDGDDVEVVESEVYSNGIEAWCVKNHTTGAYMYGEYKKGILGRIFELLAELFFSALILIGLIATVMFLLD